MNPYADSSFLVSCYVADANTPRAQAYLSAHPIRITYTALHALEVRNALKLGIYRGLFSATAAAAAWANLEADLRAGRMARTSVKWPVAFRIAAQLSEKRTASTGTRSLDILHDAAAKSLRAVEFLSFDTRQRALAAMVGLSVSP
jgi:hypothetical protein